MTTRQKNNKARFIEVYGQKACNVSATCKTVGIDRSTYYEWIKTDEDFKNKIENHREGLIDNAESILQKKILDEDTTSIIFFLKTIGRKRGYIEKQEVEQRITEHNIFKGLDLKIDRNKKSQESND